MEGPIRRVAPQLNSRLCTGQHLDWLTRFAPTPPPESREKLEARAAPEVARRGLEAESSLTCGHQGARTFTRRAVAWRVRALPLQRAALKVDRARRSRSVEAAQVPQVARRRCLTVKTLEPRT